MAAKGNQTAQVPETAETNEQVAAIEKILNAEAKTLRPSQMAVIELLSWLENIATEDTSNQGFTGDDIGNILLADDEATMWDADELPRLNAKVLSGCDLDLYGFDVKFSNDPEIASGLIGPKSRRKMYLLVKAARLNNGGQTNVYRLPDVGEEFVWNTSARFIVSKLYWLARHGRFDNGSAVKARIVGTDLGGGKSVEKLKPIDGVTIIGTAEPPF